MTDLSFDGAMQLFNAQQTEPFPVDFDRAWEWLGYSRKNNAKRALLESGFAEGIDLLINEQSDNHAGLSAQERAASARTENIRLTVDCFKQWGMMAGTDQGKQIRRYFLECERIVKMKAEAPNLQDIQDPFWQLIDGAIARGLEPEKAIDWRHRFEGRAIANKQDAQTAAPETLQDSIPRVTQRRNPLTDEEALELIRATGEKMPDGWVSPRDMRRKSRRFTSSTHSWQYLSRLKASGNLEQHPQKPNLFRVT